MTKQKPRNRNFLWNKIVLKWNMGDVAKKLMYERLSDQDIRKT